MANIDIDLTFEEVEQLVEQEERKNNDNNFLKNLDNPKSVVKKTSVSSDAVPRSKIRVTWKFANGDVITELIDKTDTAVNRNLQENLKSKNGIATTSPSSNTVPQNSHYVTRTRSNGDAITEQINKKTNVSENKNQHQIVSPNNSYEKKNDSTTISPCRFSSENDFRVNLLRQFFLSKKITFVDNTSKKGAFWIVGGKDLLPTVKELHKYGIYFRFTENGSKATQGKPGWWYSLR